MKKHESKGNARGFAAIAMLAAAAIAVLVLSVSLPYASAVAPADRYVYSGNQTFHLKSASGAMVAELQVLNDIRDNTFTDIPFGGGFVRFRLKFNSPEVKLTPADFSLAFYKNKAKDKAPLFDGYYTLEERNKTLFYYDYELTQVYDANLSRNVETRRLVPAARREKERYYVRHGSLAEALGPNIEAGRDYFFQVKLNREIGVKQGNVDIRPKFMALELKELAWLNNTYSHCRNIYGLNETQGVTLVNEPVNHGKGIFVDSSTWAAKPHHNAVAVVNSPCNQDGSVIPFEVVNYALNGSGMNNFTLFFFLNSTPYQNQTYSIYYDQSDKGKPSFSGDLRSDESTANLYKFAAGAFSLQLRTNKGGSDTWVYYGFQYDHSGYPAGFPTYFQNSTNAYFGFSGASYPGTVTCSYDYNGTLTKQVTCKSTATTATISYRLYSSNGQSVNFVDFTYKPGQGNWNLRQDVRNTPSAFTSLNPSSYANHTSGEVYRRPDNGAVYARWAGAPSSGRAILFTAYNTSLTGAGKPVTLVSMGGGNDQLNPWQGASGSSENALNFSPADVRIGVWNASSYSDSDTQGLAENLIKSFTQSIGAKAMVGNEALESGAQQVTQVNYSVVLQPMTVYGYFAGAGASSIVSVTAYISGVQKGSFAVSTQGQYGLFDVQGNYTDYGKTLELRANNSAVLINTTIYAPGNTTRVDIAT